MNSVLRKLRLMYPELNFRYEQERLTFTKYDGTDCDIPIDNNSDIIYDVKTIIDNIDKPEHVIPRGIYCYENEYCPYHTHRTIQTVDGDVILYYCAFLNKFDSKCNDEDFNKLLKYYDCTEEYFWDNIATLDLLWDSCKECGIRVEDDNIYSQERQDVLDDVYNKTFIYKDNLYEIVGDVKVKCHNVVSCSNCVNTCDKKWTKMISYKNLLTNEIFIRPLLGENSIYDMLDKSTVILPNYNVTMLQELIINRPINVVDYLLTKMSIRHRIVKVDGVSNIITSDYVPNRINLNIDKNIIIESFLG